MDRLSDETIRAQLRSLSGWTLDDQAIVKSYPFPTYGAVIAFVNQVAAIAEKQNHHPDMTVTYSAATLRYTSHDADGLTQADFDAARAVDSL